MLDCDHSPTLITGGSGSNGRSSVTVCRRCGEFHVIADKDGAHFSITFSLYGSYELIAASQAHRLSTTPAAEAPKDKRIWHPLDFADHRLYYVLRSWDVRQEDGTIRNFKDHHIVAAHAPAHAAALVEATYKESYDIDKELIPFHYAEGFALNVLQPLSWTENGIQMLNVEFDEGAFIPGEWHCPKCQMRLGTRFLSAEDMSVGVNPDPEPPDCMNECGKMMRITWRDAAHEAYLINQRLAKRIKALEDAFPPDVAMPVEEDEISETTSLPC